MGLDSYIKRKLHETKINYQAERAHRKEDRLEERNEYEKGRKIGAFERGKQEGAGRVTEATKFASRGGRVQGTTGARAVIQRSDEVFGWSGASGLGSGLGMGFGGGESKRSAPPQRITEFNPRTGKVRTIETIQPRSQEPEDSGLSLGLDFGGPPSKGKKEKHPYDIF